MPPDSPPPGSPADWLRFARSDLALARTGPQEGVLLETFCFHAQQAAEKALKSLLLHFGQSIPRTHNIGILLDLLEPFATIPSACQEVALLTDYAVTTRYPGNFEPVSEEEYLRNLQLAENLVDWVGQEIEGA